MNTALDDVGTEAAASEARGVSLLRKAHDRREADVSRKKLKVPIPGFDGVLAQYAIVDRAQLEMMAQEAFEAQRGLKDIAAANKRLEADIKFLLAANTGLFAVPDEDLAEEETDEDGHVAIADSNGPVTYHRVARLLGRESDWRTAREAVLGMFDDNGAALGDHARDVARWIRTMRKPTDLGE